LSHTSIATGLLFQAPRRVTQNKCFCLPFLCCLSEGHIDGPLVLVAQVASREKWAQLAAQPHRQGVAKMAGLSSGLSPMAERRRLACLVPADPRTWVCYKPLVCLVPPVAHGLISGSGETLYAWGAGVSVPFFGPWSQVPGECTKTVFHASGMGRCTCSFRHWEGQQAAESAAVGWLQSLDPASQHRFGRC
jgi:hypothetical protein